MSADIGLVLPNTPVGRVLHAALVRGYLTRIQAEELLAWSDWSEQSPTPGLDRMAEEAGDDPAQAAASSPEAKPTSAERARFWQQHSARLWAAEDDLIRQYFGWADPVWDEIMRPGFAVDLIKQQILAANQETGTTQEGDQRLWEAMLDPGIFYDDKRLLAMLRLAGWLAEEED
jgi:hypothetical protein